MNSTDNNVIDLTDSFTLIDHYELANIIIDLDDSVKESPVRQQKSVKTTVTSTNKKLWKTLNKTNDKKESKSIRGFGDCPICWDELGKNPLASTKCGHVYCLKCIEKYLQSVHKCPTCRRVLKGSSAYHPLYL